MCAYGGTSTSEDERFEKFQSEPGQGLGSLSCPDINRPHFVSPRGSQGKAWPICWVQVQQQGLPEWKEFPTCLWVFPHLDRLPYVAEELSPFFQKTSWSIAGSLSGVTTQGQNGPENNLTKVYSSLPNTADLPTYSTTTGRSLASCPGHSTA